MNLVSVPEGTVAHVQGFHAGRGGEDKTANPYGGVNHVAALVWLHGWGQGYREKFFAVENSNN